jgi:phosphoribosyl 1,2-cyclic phosphodiesterase
MLIKCWGSRGSPPTSGQQYLKYGGDTTCIQITAQSGQTVIIDAGTGIRQLGESLGSNAACYLLLTHAHLDHVAGFNFFKPLFHGDSVVEIQNSCFSGVTVEKIFNTLMSPPLFPITPKDLKATVRYRTDLTGTFSIGSLGVETIALNHPNGGFGFRFTEAGRCFVFLTDNEIGFDHGAGTGFDDYISFARNADLLFHDAEFTPDEYRLRRGWGHSTYTEALDLGLRSGAKRLGLFHLNQNRTDRQMDQIQADCRSRIKSEGSTLDCFAVACNTVFTL